MDCGEHRVKWSSNFSMHRNYLGRLIKIPSFEILPPAILTQMSEVEYLNEQF